MGNLKTFFWTCLGVGLVAGAGFYFYRKWTSTDGNQEAPENSGTQSTTQEASEDDDSTKEMLSDSSKDNTTTVISNKTQIEVQQGKDSSSLQNGVEKQQENATGNPTVSQKTADNTDQTKRKSTFGGLKKGFLL